MDTEGRVAQESLTGQLAQLDSDQAYKIFIEFVIDSLCTYGIQQIQNAICTGKPEIAEWFKREFPKLMKNELPDILWRARDEFKQLWPQLQSVFCEIEEGELQAIDRHWTTINKVLNSLREKGAIPSQVSNEELLSDILQGEGIIKQIPPRHPLLSLLDVENEGEWNKLTPAQQNVKLYYALGERKYPFLRLSTKLIHKWAEDSSTKSVSQGQMVYDERKLEQPIENLGVTIHGQEKIKHRPIKEDEIEYLDLPTPVDLLEHIGITRENTSEAEWQTFNLVAKNILDDELEVGSKTGFSLSAVFGADAARIRKIISRYRARQANCQIENVQKR